MNPNRQTKPRKDLSAMTVASLDDLAGKEVFVRKSSSYYESLEALNKCLAAEKKPVVVIKEAPETLVDEDLIEMVSAGLIPLIVVDKHKADFWKQVFPKIRVHDGVALRTGGATAWAIRKESPQLAAALEDFRENHLVKQGVSAYRLAQFQKRFKRMANPAQSASTSASRTRSRSSAATAPNTTSTR